MFSSLDFIERVGAENEPQQALQHLLNDCVRETGSIAGKLYFLDLEETAYVELASVGAPKGAPISLLSVGGEPESDDALLRAAIEKLSVLSVAQLPDDQDAGAVHSRLIVPLVRDRVCLGLFDPPSAPGKGTSLNP